MNRLKAKSQSKLQRQGRVRSQTKSTSARPRLNIFISNKNVTAQIIDDTKGKTLAYATSEGQKSSKKTMTDKAKEVGQEIAKKAKAAKVKKVVFDRGPKLYHGRVKSLADAAREEGLEF